MPVVSAPIVGATKPHHLADAVAALDVTLTDDEIRTLEEPAPHMTPHMMSTGRSRVLTCQIENHRKTGSD
jgi:diketogulonate reductase-like aldo/keto reductase